jgi:hypothetical protein
MISASERSGEKGVSMSDNITTQEIQKEVQQVATLKLVINKTHLGPKNNLNNLGSKKLSSAANKVRLNNNFEVKVTKDSKESKPSASVSKSLTSKSGSAPSAKECIFLVEGWARVFSEPGDPEYIRRYNLLQKARTEAYADLGINVGKEAPHLTEEQRIAYNAKVLPFAFNYYEAALSYRQPGHKAVRTKTYRFCSFPDVDMILRKIITESKQVASDLTITVRPTVEVNE